MVAFLLICDLFFLADPSMLVLRNAMLDNLLFSQNVGHYESSSYDEGQFHVWVDGSGSVWEDNSCGCTSMGVDGTSGSIAIGGDLALPQLTELRVGVYGGISGSDFDWSSSRGYGELKSYYGSVYACWDKFIYHLNASARISKEEYHLHYIVAGSGAADKKTDKKHDGYSFGFHLGGAVDLEFPDAFILQPFANADYGRTREESYRIDMPGFRMGVNAFSADLLRTELGARVFRTFAINGINLTPSIGASWVRYDPVNKNAISAKADVYKTSYVHCVRDVFSPEASLTATLGNGIHAAIKYHGEFEKDLVLNQAEASVGIRF